MPANPIVYFEIGCHDGLRSREFFSRLFDWKIAGPDEGLTIQTGGEAPIGGHLAELAKEWATISSNG